ADRSGRRPAARRPRLHQGAPGRAVVPRPASHRHPGRRRPRLSLGSDVGETAMIYLEIPKKHRTLIDQAHQVAMNMLRPISRKYDLAEHEYPKELDMLAAMIDGLDASGASEGAGATGVRRDADADKSNKNGANMASALSVAEMCWGDTGLTLSMPRQGLGNSAIASVATDEQLKKFKGTWASMAITEPSFGSDSSAITTTAKLDGDAYIINGEKIFVTSGERSDSIVVWATLDKTLGK